MPIAERTVPADTDILCEACGYTLNGLPDTGNCPECGDAILNSLTHDGRTLSEFEIEPRPRSFWRTTFRVIFDTRRFYRTLKGREDTKVAKKFALSHHWFASFGFAVAALHHSGWLLQTSGFSIPSAWLSWILWGVALAPLPLMVITFLVLTGIIHLAEWLTALESKFWGIRLPRNVVHRAMQFHAANYLPVSAIACTYAISFQQLRYMPDTWYLYGLCALVVLSAGYLFQTYWIGMKNLMYANR